MTPGAGAKLRSSRLVFAYKVRFRYHIQHTLGKQHGTFLLASIPRVGLLGHRFFAQNKCAFKTKAVVWVRTSNSKNFRPKLSNVSPY